MGNRSDAIQSCPCEQNTSEQVVRQRLEYTIYYTFYFDGTLNNWTNTRDYRRARNEEARQAMRNLGDSYLNDYSNVARQWRRQRSGHSNSQYILVKKRYTEGIGTTNQQSDSSRGAGLGTGSTGIQEKCYSAIRHLISELRRVSSQGDCESINLFVDAVGFSRGAAAARHFIHLVSNLNVSRYNTTKNYRFAGLYDTVSAHGVVHRNDVWELSLNRMGLMTTCVQLAAADEHRDNFSLTNINSGGTQHYLPGVHSDIGGGYNDGSSERLLLRETLNRTTLENDRTFLITQGYFKDFEILIQDGEIHDTGRNQWQEDHMLLTNRQSISNQYSKAVLQIMVDEATRSGALFLDFLSRFIVTDSAITEVYNDLRALVANGAVPLSRWRNSSQNLGTLSLQELRNRYCHFSAHLAPAAWGLLTPHKPRYLRGVRTRRVYRG